jgi:hypothetical protein
MCKVFLCPPLEALGDVVHHGHCGALNLAAEVEIADFLKSVVNLVRQNAGSLPNLQVFKIFCKSHTRYKLLVTRHSRLRRPPIPERLLQRPAEFLRLGPRLLRPVECRMCLGRHSKCRERVERSGAGYFGKGKPLTCEIGKVIKSKGIGVPSTRTKLAGRASKMATSKDRLTHAKRFPVSGLNP